MKDKRPIAQQAAALTKEERAMLPKLYWRRAAILAGLLLAIIAVCLYAHLSVRQAERNYDALAAQSDQNLAQDIFDPELIDRRAQAKAQYEHTQQRQGILIATGCFCGICGMVLCFCYYRASYPYFTARRYHYLHKHK